jgi:hypothetical protein
MSASDECRCRNALKVLPWDNFGKADGRPMIIHLAYLLELKIEKLN